jgi:uncharacterized OB-fold protein
MVPGVTSELRRRPVAEGLFTDEPRLLGGRCDACGLVSFPRAAGCSRCGSDHIAEHRLARRGTLWTFTVQAFPPKPPYAGPEPFEPYGVGYVELGGEIRVEGRLTEGDPERLEVGMEMELVLEPFGDDAVTYAFRPVEAG